eukprot:1449843-Rhodomonas_salina.1
MYLRVHAPPSMGACSVQGITMHGFSVQCSRFRRVRGAVTPLLLVPSLPLPLFPLYLSLSLFRLPLSPSSSSQLCSSSSPQPLLTAASLPPLAPSPPLSAALVPPPHAAAPPPR